MNSVVSQPNPEPFRPGKSVEEIFRAFREAIPQDAYAQIPQDGSTQLDHYIYGLPKQTAK